VSTDVSEKHIASIFRVEEISSARNQQASSKPTAFNRLHGAISQKIVLFIITAVKTSNSTILHFSAVQTERFDDY
jgi:hypothetical protein